MNRERELLQQAEAFLRAGKLLEAHALCESVLASWPRSGRALHLSGIVLARSGRAGDAIARLRAAVAADPSLADAWASLGLGLQAIGQPRAAVEAFEHAVRIVPQLPEHHWNLAAAHLRAGNAVEGEAAARAAIALDERAVAGWYNLAYALRAQARVLEALDAATRAHGVAPDDPACAGLKAELEDEIGASDKARQTLERTLARQPLVVPLRLQLADVLERSQAQRDAIAAYEQVLRQEPANALALSQLVFLKRSVGDWRDLPALEARFRTLATRDDAGPLSPFVLLSQESTRAEQRRCAESWTRARTTSAPPSRRRRLSHERLRIGYLSSDFFEHPTAHLTAGMFEEHDRAWFEIVGYATGRNDGSAIRQRLERAFDRFVDAASLPPAGLAEQIRNDHIDILVDLKGHTAGAPLPVLLLRPAPIQVHYLGYPGTLGGAVDYLIGDAIVTPDAHAADYAETLVRLPHSYQVNDRTRAVANDAPARRDLGLPEDALVLCNFNQGYKLNPSVFDAWMHVMREMPDAVLWLLASGDDDPLIEHLRHEAHARGVAPERLVFATRRAHADYLALYRVADLFLDSWPYNAHTTGSDALWVGCPMLTWQGETFAGRVGASLLHAVGLRELVCSDRDAFVRRAIELGRDRAQLLRLREYLQGPGRASPLFDTTATTRALERAYVAMGQQYRQITRAAIDVPH
jgi:predicted O-linked N-acetylglucosamine transferase (SPINDLY family)